MGERLVYFDGDLKSLNSQTGWWESLRVKDIPSLGFVRHGQATVIILALVGPQHATMAGVKLSDFIALLP